MTQGNQQLILDGTTDISKNSSGYETSSTILNRVKDSSRIIKSFCLVPPFDFSASQNSERASISDYYSLVSQANSNNGHLNMFLAAGHFVHLVYPAPWGNSETGFEQIAVASFRHTYLCEPIQHYTNLKAQLIVELPEHNASHEVYKIVNDFNRPGPFGVHGEIIFGAVSQGRFPSAGNQISSTFLSVGSFTDSPNIGYNNNPNIELSLSVLPDTSSFTFYVSVVLRCLVPENYPNDLWSERQYTMIDFRDDSIQVEVANEFGYPVSKPAPGAIKIKQICGQILSDDSIDLSNDHRGD